MTAQTFRRAELVLRLVLAAGIVWALSVLACPAHAAADDLDAGTLRRLDESRAEVEAGADLAGMHAVRFAALLAVETGMRPMDGWYEDVIGVGQVSWRDWAPLLRGEGWRGDDVRYDPYWGALAAGRVLGQLRIWYPGKSDALLVCLYACGPRAEKFKRSCTYSWLVRQAEQGLERRRNG